MLTPPESPVRNRSYDGARYEKKRKAKGSSSTSTSSSHDIVDAVEYLKRQRLLEEELQRANENLVELKGQLRKKASQKVLPTSNSGSGEISQESLLKAIKVSTLEVMKSQHELYISQQHQESSHRDKQRERDRQEHTEREKRQYEQFVELDKQREMRIDDWNQKERSSDKKIERMTNVRNSEEETTTEMIMKLDMTIIGLSRNREELTRRLSEIKIKQEKIKSENKTGIEKSECNLIF